MKACKFSFFITIYNAFVSVDSNSSISNFIVSPCILIH
jgi:hypothetical protein